MSEDNSNIEYGDASSYAEGTTELEQPQQQSESGKVKRSRASKPKVKTGCLTCKIRRVKCDEAKPTCKRCEKFGHQCDGYAQKSPKSASGSGSGSHGARTIVPKIVSPVDERREEWNEGDEGNGNEGGSGAGGGMAERWEGEWRYGV